MVMNLIIPTRGRPHAIEEMIHELHVTRRDSGTIIHFCVDEDDLTLEDYLRIKLYPKMLMTVSDARGMNAVLNERALEIANRARPNDIIGFMGDDHRPRTSGWDLWFNEILNIKPGVAYGDDKLQGQNLATAVFMNAWIVRKLGYIAPPNLIHLYMDNFWMALGRELNLTFLSHVIIEHMHYTNGKAIKDERYAVVNDPKIDAHDRAEFDRYMREDWPEERQKLDGSASV